MKEMCFDETLEKDLLGYTINIECSKYFVEQISEVQQKFVETFGDAIYAPKLGSLHITVVDYLSTIVDYGVSKDVLFDECGRNYSRALTQVVKGVSPFILKFNQLELFKPCAIIKAELVHSLKYIREGFIEKVALIDGTRYPSSIVHSSILAFRKPVPFFEAQELLQSFSLEIEENVREFRLIRETKNRMAEYTVLETFILDEA